MTTITSEIFEFHNKNYNVVPDDIIKTIKYYCVDYRSTSVVFPDTWKWQWIVTRSKDGYNGTLSKRIQKLLVNYKVSALYTYDIMNIVNYYISIGKTGILPENIEYEFTKQLWKSGEYQDHGSCFWRKRYAAPHVIFQSNGYGLLLRSNGEKIGRCWIKQEDNGILAFNSYGISLVNLSNLLSNHFKLPVDNIKVDSYEPVYINNCQGLWISKNEYRGSIWNVKDVKFCCVCDRYYLKKDYKDHNCEGD